MINFSAVNSVPKPNTSTASTEAPKTQTSVPKEPFPKRYGMGWCGLMVSLAVLPTATAVEYATLQKESTPSWFAESPLPINEMILGTTLIGVVGITSWQLATTCYQALAYAWTHTMEDFTGVPEDWEDLDQIR